MMRSLFLLLLACCYAGAAWAFEPFVIKDIRVEGLQRVEAGTVFSYLPVKVGDTMTDAEASQAIKALYATDFFKNVTLEEQNGVLIVEVQERPTIAQIDYVGIKQFDKDTLDKAMTHIGLAQGRIFDKSLLDKAEQELKRQYLSRGYYDVNVTTTVTPLERNRAAINFTVDEGKVAKIRQISIIGAHVFPEKTLLKQFTLRTPGFFTWYTKNDQYSREKLAADVETLRSYYLDRGYLEFRVDSTQVQITPDKQNIYITINITEGPKYTVSDVKLAGKTLLPKPELMKLVEIHPGDVFSRKKLTESTKAIGDRLGDDGYAFANVNAVPELDKKDHKAAFTFFVDPGRRVYVRRINVTGNTLTRDIVIRREMRQFEGAWYNAQNIKRSKERVDKLGFFDDVNVETPAVPGSPDEVDVNVNVKEKPTGTILLGAGFGSGEGLILSGGITQNNIFGTGNSLSVQVNGSRVNTIYSLSYTNPYWTIDGVSRGFDIYKRNYDPSYFGLGDYQTSSVGLMMRFGVPISETDTIQYGIGYDRTHISTFSDSPTRYLDYVNQFGDTATSILGTVGWIRDRRDSVIYPTKGSYQHATLETGLPGGSLKYYKASYRYSQYFPLSRNYTLYVNGQIGYANGYGNKPLPFYKNFYIGGVSTVRGFKTASIGPQDTDGTPLGGNHELLGNFEFLFPFPGLEDNKAVRLSWFVDTGMVGDTYQLGDLRYSTGLAVSWNSPLGPLKISVAKALRSFPGDEKQALQFTFGTTF